MSTTADAVHTDQKEKKPRRKTPAMPPTVRRIVGYQGLVAYLGGALTAGTLRRKVAEGNIPFLRTGPRSVVFDLDAIDHWLQTGEGVSAKEAKGAMRTASEAA